MTIKLLGIPHDCNSSFLRGAALAPPLVRAAISSDSANMFCETGFDLGDPALLEDCGDIELDGAEGQSAYDAIHHGAAQAISDDDHLIAIGGDHSVSYPLIMAHAARHEGLSILHFDAHPDLYEDFQGNPFSHASPFARLMESGKITRLVQIGIRTFNDHQRAQAERYGVEVHEMRDLSGLTQIGFDGPVYVSIDLDALDPAYAPGVSHQEPGGLSTRQVIHLVQRVPGTIIGGDIVEYNPTRDLNEVTAMVAAKLVKELAGRILRAS